MIRLAEIAEAGHFNKPHGIKGEMSATLDFDLDLDNVKCIIVPVEGIFVPFSYAHGVLRRLIPVCLLLTESILT